MRVVVLGCGYVGLELGRQLQDRGHEVVGVRRSSSGLAAVRDAGLTAVEADVTEREALSTVPDADVVVFAASSGGRGAEAAREVYVEGQRTALAAFGERAEPPDRYCYTSSTGVYGDHGGDWVDEETPPDPVTEKTEVLVQAEQVALEEAAEYGIDGTVARLAGLYGPERYRLRRYVEGPVTEGVLNMVHRDDAAGAVRHCLTADVAREEVVLVVDDEPVEKWTFADQLAAACGEPSPPKRTVKQRLAEGVSETVRRRLETRKRCANDRLRELGYEFAYPTFREGYEPAVEAWADGG